MTTPMILFTAAALVGVVAGHPLARARWAAHSPRLAVALWHALCLGMLSSVVLGGLSLAQAALPRLLAGGVGDLLARCGMALRAEFSTPYSAILGTIGLLLALATAGRGFGSVAAGARDQKRARRAQLAALEIAGHRLTGAPGEALVLLDDDRPAAYCLAGAGGSRGTIVVSSGALDLLDDDQVRLVLEHERAHLRQRHHVATRLSVTLAGAFSSVPLFRLAAQHVPLLLEMAADDQAMRATAMAPGTSGLDGTARRRLARALLQLASAQSPSPAGALAAASGSAVARVRRLSQPPQQLGVARSTMLGGAVVLAFAGPLLVVSAPAVCAAVMRICPFVFT